MRVANQCNLPLEADLLGKEITSLRLGQNYNNDITGVVPPSLTSIEVGPNFEHTIPDSITHLNFSNFVKGYQLILSLFFIFYFFT